jgi:hypothetical protein
VAEPTPEEAPGFVGRGGGSPSGNDSTELSSSAEEDDEEDGSKPTPAPRREVVEALVSEIEALVAVLNGSSEFLSSVEEVLDRDRMTSPSESGSRPTCELLSEKSKGLASI